MKKVAQIIGVIVVLFVVLFGLGYLILRPKPLQTPEAVNSLAELEAYLDELTGYNADWNQTELIRTKLPDYAELAYEPGSQGIYTNVGYMVLAAVIEAVSGQAYEQYITEHILKPLEMDQTGFLYSEAMVANEAAGAHPNVDVQTMLLPFLVDNKDRLIREKHNGVLWFNHIYSDQNGPTGLIGPPTDIARFLIAYLNGGELNGQRILLEASIDLMTHESHIAAGKTPETSGFDEIYHGLGWFVLPQDDGFHIRHRGGGPGFAANMRLYPDRNLGLVIMANGTYLDSRNILDLAASLDW